jgi:hypothetical protein
MPLSWNEIKSRALAFSRHWADAGNEDAEAKPFLIDFFEIFGITNKRIASFEHAVKKYGGGAGYVDLFWPGILLVEMKSRGRNLDRAYTQAMDYFPGIVERDLPRFVLVCDFARFRLYDLTENATMNSPWPSCTRTCACSASSPATRRRSSSRRTRSTSRPPSAWGGCTTS